LNSISEKWEAGIKFTAIFKFVFIIFSLYKHVIDFLSYFSGGGQTPGAVSQVSGFNTPGSIGATSLQTPLRDSLNINMDEALEAGGATPAALKSFQRHARDQLRQGLSSLPVPKNDYEIVVPEDEEQDASAMPMDTEEDQADVDARRQEIIKRKCKDFFIKKI